MQLIYELLNNTKMANKTINELTAVTSLVAGDELEVQKSGETTTKKATVTQVLAVEATARAAQDDVIEAGVGLNTNGTYPSLTNAWYIRAAEFAAGVTDRGGATGALTENVMNALRILDAAIYGVATYAYTSDVIKTATVTLSTADILAINAVPKVLLPNLGAGWAYEVISAIGINTFGTAAFEAGTAKLEIKHTGGAVIAEFDNAFIEAGAKLIHRAIPTSNGAMVSGSVVAYCGTAPTPATGDGSIAITLTYRLHAV